MAKKKFIIELIDVPYLAAPNIASIDVELTAKRIVRYRSGHSTKTYDPNMKQITDMVTGIASAELLKAQFASLKEDAWRANVERLPTHRAALPVDAPRAVARRADRARSGGLRALDLLQQLSEPADHGSNPAACSPNSR